MKRSLLLGCWLACAALGLGLAACSRADVGGAERCAATDAGTPVDPLLLAFLSRARSAHHLADEQENSGQLAQAVIPLAALVQGPLPHANGTELGPEVREVLADTHARLADLQSRLGAFDEALANVQAGLEQVSEQSYFRGHLLETQGVVEERRAKALEHSDAGAAAAARQRAIGLLEQAMAVQAAVIASAAPGLASASNPAASASPAPSAH